MMKRGSRKASARRMQRENGAIEPELLQSEVAILSGGSDLAGNPLVTFPIRSLVTSRTWDIEGACRYLVYLQDIIYLIMKRKSAAFVANFRHVYSDEVMIDVIKALEHLEIERHGSVAVFYVVKPKARGRSNLMKKLLGLKTQKKEPLTSTSQFKTILLKNSSDLLGHIDSKELTTDYGGHLVYDHDSWVYLHKKILPTLAKSEDVKDKVHDVRDKVLLMADYDTAGQEVGVLKSLHEELEDQFNAMIRHSDIELTIEKCKQTLHHLDDPDEDSPVVKVHPTLLTQIMTQIRNAFTELSTIETDLEDTWKYVDKEFRKEISLKEKKTEADKLCMEITERFWPVMAQHPHIGTKLSQAELYRAHFKSMLYDPAKEIIADATAILETLQKIHGTESDGQNGMRGIVERLTNTIHPFATQLNELNQIYVELHVFFLVFEKTIYDKEPHRNALSWYTRALDVIPTSLCSRAANGDSDLLCMLPGWRQTIQSFLRNHPVPRDDHIAHIDVNLPDTVDRTTIHQARLLADRLRLMIRVFRSSRLDASLLCHIYDWKIEKLSNTGNLYFPDEEDDDHYATEIQPSTVIKHSPLKRRVGRITPPDRTRFERISPVEKAKSDLINAANASRLYRREAGSVIHRRTRDHQTLRRTSSADTDKHLSNNSSSVKTGCKCSSELSLNHTARNIRDLDNVVQFIQKLTSSRSMSSEKKLQFVSELILNLEITESDDESDQKQSRRKFSPSAKVIRKLSRKHSVNNVKEKKPSEQLADLNRRLCRSLDNILDIDLDTDQVKKVDQTKSFHHLAESHVYNRLKFHKNDDISVVHELSSHESIDSVVNDDSSSIDFLSSDKDESNHKQNLPLKSPETHSTFKGQEPSTKSYIIIDKHSRERSIDCHPTIDSKRKSNANDVSKQSSDDNREGFKRRSVVRIASKNRKRRSWNMANSPESCQDLSTLMKGRDVDPLEQDKTNKIKSGPSHAVSLNALDFSSGIFGSAPRKSMLSISTDLGYDSQQDHGISDELVSKDMLTSPPIQKDRRNSITCGTSVLRLRRSVSTDDHVTPSSSHENNFKEYKV